MMWNTCASETPVSNTGIIMNTQTDASTLNLKLEGMKSVGHLRMRLSPKSSFSGGNPICTTSLDQAVTYLAAVHRAENDHDQRKFAY